MSTALSWIPSPSVQPQKASRLPYCPLRWPCGSSQATLPQAQGVLACSELTSTSQGQLPGRPVCNDTARWDRSPSLCGSQITPALSLDIFSLVAQTHLWQRLQRYKTRTHNTTYNAICSSIYFSI